MSQGPVPPSDDENPGRPGDGEPPEAEPERWAILVDADADADADPDPGPEPGADPDGAGTAPTEAAGPHPRMAARRLALQRAADGRAVRRVAVVGTLAALLALVLMLAESPLFNVDRIEVAGADGARADAVAAATGVALGDPMWRLDVGAIRDSVAAVPWVESADVTRTWPGTLRVRVRASRVVGWMRTELGRVALVDDRGMVVERVGEAPAGAVEIRSDDPTPNERGYLNPRRLGEVLAGLPPRLRAALVRVELGADTVRLVVRGPGVGVTAGAEAAVDWCSASNGADKARVTGRLLERAATGEMTWAAANVCVPSRPAITPAAPPTDA